MATAGDVEDDDFDWIGDQVPCFATRGENIQILKEPKQFYSELLVGVFTLVSFCF